MRGLILLIGAGCFSLMVCAQAKGAELMYSVGASKVDVTPTGPIRLCGYAVRKTESEGVEQKLWVRAVAISAPNGEPAVLVSVDNTALAPSITEEVAARLAKKTGLKRERLVVTCTHTHCAPLLEGTIPNMFGVDIPEDQRGRIREYTKQLTDRIEEAALAAIADRKAASLSWGQGKAAFAANRRTKDGPVDHDMPVLVARDGEGKVRAVVTNYACHCTTLGGDFNLACGDWAGYAAEGIEGQNAGAVALITIGCGADANPAPRGKLEHAKQHGQAIATETRRLLKTELMPLTKPVEGKFKRIDLPFDKLPTKEEWQKRAEKQDAIGYNARMQLAKLEREGKLPESIPYPVQTWTFGDELGMVFLGGEVVVDYARRIKTDFDPKRTWVTSYANDVPCYIPSKRILSEGGYEAEGAMTYYGHPGRLAPGVENQIIRTVHELMPSALRAEKSLEQYPLPKSPEESRATIQMAEGLAVELVVSEPLVVDPVAIDWGVDGALWVVEARDFPTGLNENGTPGGRIKRVTDSDGDGKYDTATIYADGLSGAQGVMAWRNGVLVCAAPNIWYCEDTDGDGTADVKKVLFSGFSPENEQWMVNGLAWGLDGWVYGASSIRNEPIRIGEGENPKTVELGGRDFRMDPDTLKFEPAAGRTQFVRVRDDWGNWFGNDNSTPLWHYPLDEHHFLRNPHVTPPGVRTYVASGKDATRVYPVSRLLERFNDPHAANRATSACGPGIYRDQLLGAEYSGNAFYCEPVHNLVTRLVLEAKGATFTGRRAKGEEGKEFLASTDNWFRPVQVRTGPDGALWVVDMYRYVVEHPRWITAERMRTLDVRAGDDRGRIYRVVPKGAKSPAHALADMSKLSSAELAQRMESTNGTVRDIVHRELVHRKDSAALPFLRGLASKSGNPAVRLQAMWAIEGLGGMNEELLLAALKDAHAGVRRAAVQLSEDRLEKSAALLDAVSELVLDADAAVRYQVALSAWHMPETPAAALLQHLVHEAATDVWMRAAVINSSARAPLRVLKRVVWETKPGAGRDEMVREIAAMAVKMGADVAAADVLVQIAPAPNGVIEPWRMEAAATVLEAMNARGRSIDSLAHSLEASAACRRMIQSARALLADARMPLNQRVLATRLMLYEQETTTADIKLLATLLRAEVAPALQTAAVTALARAHHPDAVQALLTGWRRVSPAARAQLFDVMAADTGRAEILLGAIKDGRISAGELSAAQRDRLLRYREAGISHMAAEVLAAVRPRAKVLEEYKPVLAMKGNAGRGAGHFAKLCASCHQLNGMGYAVGPDLRTLTDRSTSALLTAILDPNAALDGKFLAYAVELKDGRAFSGIVVDESAAGLVILQGNGLRDTVARSGIKKMHTAGLSLMPEGIEEGLAAQDLADLIAFVQSDVTAQSIARQALDEGKPNAEREAALKSRPDLAVEVIREMTKDLPKDQEYKRIPWIWRASIDIGRRNEADEIRRLLDLALPKEDGEMRDWQAVVIGGGVINGISNRGEWPAKRVAAVVGEDEKLRKRWERSIALAGSMADDEKVPHGTRYDALRMIAMMEADAAIKHLAKYLGKDVHAELQQGAVSGLVDVESESVAGLLLAAWPQLTAGNRHLAGEGMLRTGQRAGALLDAMLAGQVKSSELNEGTKKRLLEHSDAAIKKRAAEVLAK